MSNDMFDEGNPQAVETRTSTPRNWYTEIEARVTRTEHNVTLLAVAMGVEDYEEEGRRKARSQRMDEMKIDIAKTIHTANELASQLTATDKHLAHEILQVHNSLGSLVTHQQIAAYLRDIEEGIQTRLGEELTTIKESLTGLQGEVANMMTRWRATQIEVKSETPLRVTPTAIHGIPAPERAAPLNDRWKEKLRGEMRDLKATVQGRTKVVELLELLDTYTRAYDVDINTLVALAATYTQCRTSRVILSLAAKSDNPAMAIAAPMVAPEITLIGEIGKVNFKSMNQYTADFINKAEELKLLGCRLTEQQTSDMFVAGIRDPTARDAIRNRIATHPHGLEGFFLTCIGDNVMLSATDLKKNTNGGNQDKSKGDGGKTEAQDEKSCTLCKKECGNKNRKKRGCKQQCREACGTKYPHLPRTCEKKGPGNSETVEIRQTIIADNDEFDPMSCLEAGPSEPTEHLSPHAENLS